VTTLGQIIIVNGTSGSGKSTACELFAREADDYWMLYGIDHFTAGTLPAKFGHHGPNAGEGIEAVPLDPADPDGPLRWQFHEKGARAFAVLHEWIASASRGGVNIVFDHLLMSGPGAGRLRLAARRPAGAAGHAEAAFRGARTPRV